MYYAVNDLQPEVLGCNNPGNVITFDSSNNHISLVLDPDQIAFTPLQIIFTNGDWQQPRIISVSALNDDFTEREIHDTALSFDVASDPASVYYGQTVSNVTVLIEDNN